MEEIFLNIPDYEYKLTPDGKGMILTGYNGTGGEVVIQAAYNGVPVKEIGRYVFRNCAGLVSIVLPEGMTGIGESAFEGCTGLRAVTLPGSVTEIGWSAFEGCTGLTTIIFPGSVTKIGWWAFKDCTGLTSVTLPASVKTIGDSAFGGCPNLTIRCPEGSAAWNYCEKNGIPHAAE